jgi:predicted ferric reductase
MIAPQTQVHAVKGFRPYNGTSLDTPFFHILVEPLLPILKPVMAVIYAVRWQLSRPLQIRVLPSWFPFIDYPFLKTLPFLTLGQILLTLPLVALILSGYYFTFVSPDVERSGDIASYAIFATFLTANKSNSITAFFLGIPFERMIPYHNLSSLATVVLSFFHGYVAFAYGEGGASSGSLGLASDGSTAAGSASDASGDSGDRKLDSEDSAYGLMGPSPDLFKFLFDGSNNTSGSLLAISMIVLVLSSIFPIFRRKFFDLWLWTHILAAICVVIFCTMHEVTSIIFIAGWWALDILMRYLIMAGCRYPHKASLELVTDDILKVSFSRPEGFQYNAGQFVQVAFPDLGVFAFHPISISSAPHEALVTLHVRALGNWSKKLVQLAKEKGEVPILIEGPYGSLSMDIDDDSRYQMALLVSGGIGVTHCQSVAKSLLNDHRHGRKLKNLRFVWAMRDLEMLKVMAPLESQSNPVDIELPEFRTEIMDLSDSSKFSSTDESRPQRSEIVETDIFLTKASPSVPVTMDDGRSLFFGRPDLNAIVADMKERANQMGVTHVMVFGCGPKVLIDKLKDVCRQHSKTVVELQGVTFDIHEEIFDF